MAKTYRLGPARRAANVMMTAMITIGLGPRSSYLLTTTGCKSGKLRTTPVTVVHSQGYRLLVAPYGNVSWVHNVRAHSEVSLRRGSKTENFHAESVTAQNAGAILEQYLREVPITAPYFDASVGDPVSRFVSEAAQHPVFRLTARA